MAQLGESFVIRKQPHGNRASRHNMITWENTVNVLESGSQFRRVWLETAIQGANRVFLIGSFVNWECALLCERIGEKFGVWVDLPMGRHEFRFLADGEWHTAANYSQAANEYGEPNNWLNVE